jgi:hypothetical protein
MRKNQAKQAKKIRRKSGKNQVKIKRKNWVGKRGRKMARKKTRHGKTHIFEGVNPFHTSVAIIFFRDCAYQFSGLCALKPFCLA